MTTSHLGGLRLGAPRHEHKRPRGTLQTWFPAEGVSLHRLEGHADVSMAEAIADHLEAQYAKTGLPIVIFDDFDDVTSYDSETRLSMMSWTKKHAAMVAGVHILFHSKLVAMGVSVANLGLGGNIRSYNKRAAFEAALQACKA
jgi:membrane protease subunit (stomatin/prohibitin family)